MTRSVSRLGTAAMTVLLLSGCGSQLVRSDADTNPFCLLVGGGIGAGTAAAVKKFQADRNLAADGIAGRMTMAALESGLKPGSSLRGGRASFAGRLLAWLRTRV